MDTFPCENCGKPVPSIMSRRHCDKCCQFWDMAYEAGRAYESEYGECKKERDDLSR